MSAINLSFSLLTVTPSSRFLSTSFLLSPLSPLLWDHCDLSVFFHLALSLSLIKLFFVLFCLYSPFSFRLSVHPVEARNLSAIAQKTHTRASPSVLCVALSLSWHRLTALLFSMLITS